MVLLAAVAAAVAPKRAIGTERTESGIACTKVG